MTDEEVQEFIDIDGLLNDDPNNIDDAMERFHALGTARASWLLDHALENVPGVELFSADAPVDPSDHSPEPLDSLARSLGISTPPPQPPPTDPQIP